MKTVSTRRIARAVGSRAGRLSAELVRAANQRMSRELARMLADVAIEKAAAGPRPIPGRWRALFTRAFVQAAVQAFHQHPIVENPKYGVA